MSTNKHMPRKQRAAVDVALRTYLAEGIVPTWHYNSCGCCVAVHADVERPRCGFLIGKDGGTDWLDMLVCS